MDLSAARSVDVVLIDMDLTKADSIELVRLLASECPVTKTLIVRRKLTGASARP